MEAIIKIYSRVEVVVVKGFFGWKNFKWFCINILYTFSHKKSFFSRKRIESAILFTCANATMTAYILAHLYTLTPLEMGGLYGAQMVYAGYQMDQIQKEKLSLDVK